MTQIPTLDDVWRAAERIAGHVRRTPVLDSASLNALSGAELYFKCENFQRMGAFKFRGACNAVMQLGAAEAARGVATHSSGNHAAALALAAQRRGIKATVVMPENTLRPKIENVRRYGGEIHLCGTRPGDREAMLAEILARTGAVEVHPYTHPHVIAGQGTAALELVREVGRLDVLVAPVSGGGLLGGSAIAGKGLLPALAIVGAEPAGADDAARSLHSGQLQGNREVHTICDGLRANLGAINFEILRSRGAEIINVEDAATLAAMRLIYERLKIVIEPSCAIVLAAVLQARERFAGRRVGLILSGGNVDLDVLPFGAAS